MKVYTVRRGTFWEGGWVVGVYADLDSARYAVQAEILSDDDKDDWVMADESEKPTWCTTCDFLEISEHTVESYVSNQEALTASLKERT